MISERSTDLYHCTKSNSLINILKTKYFRYSYCLEEFYMPEDDYYVVKKLAYAMVCFADLLEKEVEGHMEQFMADSYIVMDKKWALQNDLSPVIYYGKKSLPHSSLLFLTKRIKLLYDTGLAGARELINAIGLLRPYYKLYKGHYFLKGTDKQSKDPVEFFLEREWRSIPSVKRGEHFYLELEEYLDDEFRNKATQELCDHGYRLKFEWDDILRIAYMEEKKDEVLQTICESFGVNENEADNKTVIIHI